MASYACRYAYTCAQSADLARGASLNPPPVGPVGHSMPHSDPAIYALSPVRLCRILLVLAIVLLAGAGTASIATQAVVKQASPSLSADNLIASMEALLAAAKAKEAVRLDDTACAQMAAVGLLLVQCFTTGPDLPARQPATLYHTYACF